MHGLATDKIINASVTRQWLSYCRVTAEIEPASYPVVPCSRVTAFNSSSPPTISFPTLGNITALQPPILRPPASAGNTTTVDPPCTGCTASQSPTSRIAPTFTSAIRVMMILEIWCSDWNPSIAITPIKPPTLPTKTLGGSPWHCPT